MKSAAAGFTLLEIVVALAIFGFLLLGLSQTVRFGLTAWRQEVRLSESKSDLEVVDRSLRSIVENFAPGDDSGQSVIQGTMDSITGISRLRVPGAGMAIVPVEAGLAVSGSRLVLRWRRYYHGVSFKAVPAVNETELIGGVSRLRIEYFQPPGSWLARWHEPDLPLLVRFRIVFAGEHPPRWPDIVVAPRLSRP